MNFHVGLLALLPGSAGIAVAVLLAGLATGSIGVQAQEAGATYTGPIDVVVEAQCGGGTISLTVSADGSSITQVALDGTYVGGVSLNDLSDPAGPFVIPVNPGIAIAEDGSFSGTAQAPGGHAEGDVQGQFEGNMVSGTFGVPALKCVDVPFSAVAGIRSPALSPVAVPATGSGTGSSGDSTGLWVVLAAAALAVLCLGVGLRARSKRG